MTAAASPLETSITMPLRKAAAFAAALFIHSISADGAAAQHEGHVMPAAPDSSRPVRDTVTAHPSSHAPLGIPMDRLGSGTTWIPDGSTVPSRHVSVRGWDVMMHGFVFVQGDLQGSKRGDEQFGSLNWGMLMASRKLAGGTFQARTMLSLDPLTVTPRGYPLLLQTGESYDGKPLHDRQHPHDFWMELAALYQRELTSGLAWSLYVAPSGEPALGPVAFMHRPSAMDNPAAPLSHHWQDATHVSFGVVTAGLFSRRWQIEASAFNGTEPDEHRWNFDRIKIDSWSGRVTFNPTINWSLAAGAGHLDSPEPLHSNESMQRYTASVLYGRKIGGDGQSATSLVWGSNRHGSPREVTHSLLLENETIFGRHDTFFGRAEVVQKSAEDLVLEDELPGVISLEAGDEQRFNVGAVQVGYIREIARTRWATWGVGAAGTINFVPSSLEGVYGSRNPLGAFVFVRLRPFHRGKPATGGMDHMNMGGPQ